MIIVIAWFKNEIIDGKFMETKTVNSAIFLSRDLLSSPDAAALFRIEK